MAKQIKPKYPLDREKQSLAFQESQVTTSQYTSDPSITIRIKGEYSDSVLNDLQNAVDDILKHHEK